MDFGSSQFWIGVGQIIAIDLVLGGDNAVVIALACRNLPPQQRNRGIFWGVFGAIALRVIMILFAVTLLAIPYLKIVGGALLIWIGIKLLQPQVKSGGHEIAASASLVEAIKTIVIADAVMSLDNVIAIAGAARDSVFLIVFGLAVSVPIIVWGSKLVLKMMDRLPFVIVLGAGLLGWIAGSMAVEDVAVKDLLDDKLWHWIAPVAGALFVVAVGKWLGHGKSVEAAVDLAIDDRTRK